MITIKLVDFIHDIIEESKGTTCYKTDLKDKISPEMFGVKAEAQKYCEKFTNILNRKKAIKGNGALTLHFNWEPSSCAKLQLKLQGPWLQRLVEICGKRIRLQINVRFTVPNHSRFETRCSPKTCLEIMSPSANEAFCEYQHRKDSSGTDFGIHLNLNKSLRLIIYLIILDDYLPDLDLDQLAAVCKTVQENIQKDVTILANSTDGPGQEVLSANKAFLMAHSPVLKALFEGNIAESNKYTIKMEFSVDCVQAMLDYMFTLSFWPAIKSSRLAVKLFQAAHHYQIQHLEDKLVEMLLERRNSWFEADAAFELFQTASRIELHSSAELKKKAVEILKSKGNLRESAELAKLYDEDRDTALELTSVALAN